MTTLLLIRHGLTDAVGKKITGRLPGVAVNAEGERQIATLPDRLMRYHPTALYASPLERARQTAQPIADRFHLDVHITEALQEYDFGEWSGRTLDELNTLPPWKAFNHYRSGSRAPGGEYGFEVQARMIRECDRIRTVHADETVACVTHADPIRFALAFYLQMPLDLFHRIEVSPASLSVVTLDEWGPHVVSMNQTA